MLHLIGAVSRVALAESNNCLFLICIETIMRTLWPAGVVLERSAHRHQSTLTELVEIAATDAERGGHVRSLLSLEQCHDGLQPMHLLGKNVV